MISCANLCVSVRRLSEGIILYYPYMQIKILSVSRPTEHIIRIHASIHWCACAVHTQKTTTAAMCVTKISECKPYAELVQHTYKYLLTHSHSTHDMYYTQS